jgi:uncharacterized protein (DUF433 family)
MGLNMTYEDKQLENYHWLVTNPDRFGGKPTVKGTRFTVSFILECLSEGLSYKEIVDTYAPFPEESVSEVLKFAAKKTDTSDVTA